MAVDPSKKSGLSLDVSFDVPQKEIDRLKKILHKQIKIDAEDPLWVKNREKIKNLTRDIDNFDKDINKLNKDRIKLEDEITKRVEKEGHFQEKQEHRLERVDKYLKAINKRREKSASNQAIINELNEKEKKIKEDTSNKIASLQSEQNKYTDQIKGSDLQWVELHKNLNDKTIEQSKLQDDLLKTEKERTSVLNKYRATQSAIASLIEKQNPSMDRAEALKHAKRMFSLNGKQTNFEKTTIKSHEKLKKYRKESIRGQLVEIKARGHILRQMGGTEKEVKRIMAAEKAALYKREGKGIRAGIEGFKSKSLGEHAVEGAKSLLAFAGIGMFIGMFIKAMLDANKQIKDAQKNIFKFGAVSGTAWAKIQKGEIIGTKQLDGYRKTLDTMYDRAGMTLDEAVQNLGALTSTGVKFGDVMAKNGKLMVDVNRMATLSGMSFGEMSSISGEWVTEFGKQTNELGNTFDNLMSATSRTNMTTTRFFSSVMNAAQGLAIYGDRIEDVSFAFADLTAKVKMPQKQAAQMATSMLNNVNTMTAAQKTLVTQSANVRKLLEQEQKDLADNGQTETDRYKQLNELLKANLDPLEEGVRLFEALDPAARIKAQIKAMAVQIPQLGQIDIMNAEQLRKVMLEHRTKISEIAPSFGMTEDQIRFVEKLSEAGTSIGSIGKAMSAEEAKNIKKHKDEQADIITQGTKSIQDILANKIAKFMRDIYTFLADKVGPAIFGIWNLIKGWLGRDYAETAKVNQSVLDEIERLNQSKEKVTAEITELETKQKAAKGPEKQAIAGKISLKKAHLADITGKMETMKGYEKKISEKPKMKEEERYGISSAVAGSKLTDLSHAMANVTDKETRRLGYDAVAKLSGNKNFTDAVLSGDKEKLKSAVEGSAMFVTANKELNDIFKNILGYASGGYTGQGPTGQVAGLAHKGEFVFDKDATMKAGPSNLKSLMQAIKFQSVPTAAALTPPAAIGAAAANTGGSTYNNNVVLNINQRDRQEIEQIIYKVLYDRGR